MALQMSFYSAFWQPCKHLATCLNCAHDHGELSTSQRQVVITLSVKKVETKGLSEIGDQYLSLMST